MKNGLFLYFHTQDASKETAVLLNQFYEVEQKVAGFLLHILSDLNADE